MVNTEELNNRWIGIELKLNSSQARDLYGDTFRTFRSEGTPISSQCLRACARSTSARVGEFKTCMKKLEEAIMRLEAILRSKCNKVLISEMSSQSPSLKRLLPETLLLDKDQIKVETFAIARKPTILVFMTAVFRHPSDGRRNSAEKSITKGFGGFDGEEKNKMDQAAEIQGQPRIYSH